MPGAVIAALAVVGPVIAASTGCVAAGCVAGGLSPGSAQLFRLARYRTDNCHARTIARVRVMPRKSRLLFIKGKPVVSAPVQQACPQEVVQLVDRFDLLHGRL